MQINQTAERPVAMTHTYHQEADAQRRSIAQLDTGECSSSGGSAKDPSGVPNCERVQARLRALASNVVY